MTDYLNALKKGYKLAEYEIVRVLGVGGFGITYVAYDDNLAKGVAIKEYLPNDFALRTDGATVKPKSTHDQANYAWGLNSFLDEARTLARFKHPNLVHVYRCFEANGTAYIVMEYVEGETLTALLNRKGCLNETELKAVLLPIMDGLTQVHQANFLHRDIKPGNIVISAQDGNPVLIDFGAARQAVGAISKSVTAICTPGYAPLEQYSTKGNFGAWTDIYALGAVGYVALTGRSVEAATDRIVNDELIPAAQCAKNQASQTFLNGIDNALKNRPEDRPQTLKAWRAMLMGGEAVAPQAQAKPIPAEKTAVKSKGAGIIKRHRTKIGVAALVAFIGGGWFYVDQQQKATSQSPITPPTPTLAPIPIPETEPTPKEADHEKPTEWRDYLAEARAWDAYKAKDYEKAFELYSSLAEQGVVIAQVTLGAMYDEGQGVAQDLAKAVEWFRKAAEQGETVAQFNLGASYANGEGVAQDDANAVEWYALAAKQGLAIAQYNLGWMYGNGRGVVRDYAKVYEWWSKAAFQGHSKAQHGLGALYEDGQGVAQDYARAYVWLDMADRSGDEKAKEWREDIENKLSISELQTAKALAEQCFQSNYQNCDRLAETEREIPTLEKAAAAYDAKDYATAFQMYSSLAEQGFAEAQLGLGMMYFEGLGVAQDDVKAVAWFRKAIEQGDALAQASLGLMYFKGLGVAQNYVQAFEWTRKAAEQGQTDAQFFLGFLYEEGHGAAQNYVKAFEWTRKAVEQGDGYPYGQAQSKLGAMYGLGRGVAQDDVRAYVWFDMADKNGDEDAKRGREKAEKELSTSELQRAKALAEQCFNSRYKNCDE